MTAYYNEFDPKAAAWLRELISRGLIAPGEVDERSIANVRPDELLGFTQCHWFAGIGGWSYALRLAGWPDDRPVWTGSCPCQPYSSAGARGGADDPRNLWWAFRWHIDQCRPATVFGEQVASADGREWLAGVSADLEQLGYQVGAADLCAASVGAPHIRQRLFWLGQSISERSQGEQQAGAEARTVDGARAAGWLPNTKKSERDERPRSGEQPLCDEDGGDSERLADSDGERCGRARKPLPDMDQHAGKLKQRGDGEGQANGWIDYSLIRGADGKARRIKSGIEPLVDGISGGLVRSGDPGVPENTGEARMMRIRGYGNAIVPALASRFIQVAM